MRNFGIGVILGAALTTAFFMLAYEWGSENSQANNELNDDEQVQAVTIFVPNTDLDVEAEGRVYPLDREVTAADNEELVVATLGLLLAGDLTEAEEDEGYYSSFPEPEFNLLSSELSEGVLTLEFSQVPGFTTGGSLQMLTLRSQIEQTALQFGFVDEVIIKPETLFQP